jgi:hypothetical protein
VRFELCVTVLKGLNRFQRANINKNATRFWNSLLKNVFKKTLTTLHPVHHNHIDQLSVILAIIIRIT